MSESYDLSVVIPVYNAADTLRTLTEDFLSISHFSIQVILVDDGSSDGGVDLANQLSDDHENVESIVQGTNQGAGIARNVGFEKAVGRYTIFFDADDIVHADVICDAINGLDEGGADVAMMPYFYRRSLSSSHDAMNLNDSKVWSDIMGRAKRKTVKLDDAASLLGFSNYPWNKVIRTKTFREVGLRYGSTPVNNDILGHWYSLLFADDILLIDSEVCTHIVEASGSNLTNQASHVRLTLFDALDETYDVLDARPELRSRYAHHYWSFVHRTSRWAYGRLEPQVKPAFNERYKKHLNRIDLSDYSSIRRRRSPSLADSILSSLLY